MTQWVADIFNSLGGFVMTPLPAGVGYWLYASGVTALVGGFIAGVTISFTIGLALKFGGGLSLLAKLK